MTIRKIKTLALAFMSFFTFGVHANEVAVPPIDSAAVAEQKLTAALDNLSKEVDKRAEQAAPSTVKPPEQPVEDTPVQPAVPKNNQEHQHHEHPLGGEKIGQPATSQPEIPTTPVTAHPAAAEAQATPGIPKVEATPIQAPPPAESPLG